MTGGVFKAEITGICLNKFRIFNYFYAHLKASDLQLSFQVGFIINPALPKHSGQYTCTARYGGRSNEYGINLNVLMQTR